MTSKPDLPPRLALRRVIIAGACGAVAFAVAMAWLPWQAATAIGWSGAAAVFLARVWRVMLARDAKETARDATRNDDSRVAADLFLLAACVGSLVAVGALLVAASRAGGVTKGVFTAIAVLTVVLSWSVVHTIFTLRYGKLYYDDTPGGIDFGESEGGRAEPPTYRDFAYVAFTIGMTYQVSDTDLTTRDIRATALRHALLSFLFGTAIIAMTINVVAGLLH